MTQPTIIDRYLDVAQSGYPAVIRYSTRTMAPKAIFIHIQEGNNWGSWQHFHAVTASSTVLIGKNGDIWRLVREDKAPWTNGDVKSPTAKGRALLNQYGSDPNLYSLTIEVEGFSGDVAPDAQFASIMWQVRDWQGRYNIPTERVYRHADVNQITRPGCPGDVLFNRIIKALGGSEPVPSPTPTQPTKYATPQIPAIEGKPWDGSKDGVLNAVQFHAQKQTVTTSGVLNRRQWASPDSDMTGTAHAAGTKVNVLGWCLGANVENENRWWIAANGDRLWVGGTNEKPNEGVPPSKPVKGTRVVNGISFIPVTGKFKFSDATNIRQWATTDSALIKTLPAGTIIEPAYKVIGQKVAGVDEWFVLNEADIRNGGRIWSGTSKST